MTLKERLLYGSAGDRESAPVWLLAIQAAAVGIVAGLVLSAVLSMGVLHGTGIGPSDTPPSECRRARPARDGATPSTGPAAGTVRGQGERVRL